MVLRRRIFSLEEVLREAIEIYGQPDHGGAEAGRGWCCSVGSVPVAFGSVRRGFSRSTSGAANTAAWTVADDADEGG